MARKFGIEVEFGFDQGLQAAADALQAAGLGDGRVYPYNRNAPAPFWTIKSDSSVRGGEMVSPPLLIDEPEHRAQVDTAIKALKDAGAYTHSSAGIHIHIDGAGMDAVQVASVARIFTKFEDCIYRVASSGWETMRPGTGTYCKPLEFDHVKRIAKAKTLDQVAMGYYNVRTTDQLTYRQQSHHDSARYYGLNLHSWFYRKTIEFRIFNSSLNSERVQGYIGMCMAMVQDARNGFKRSINVRYALGGMADGTTNEVNARHRFLQVLRYDGGMDVEDMKRLTKIWKDSKPQTRATLGIY